MCNQEAGNLLLGMNDASVRLNIARWTTEMGIHARLVDAFQFNQENRTATNTTITAVGSRTWNNSNNNINSQLHEYPESAIA